MFDMIPENLEFEVGFESTKMKDKSYVINENTGEYIGIVGSTFTCESHGNFFRKVIDTTTETLSPYQMEGANIRWKSAHQNGWAMMDMQLPNMSTVITNDFHKTKILKRIIALHGVNGTCSNIAIFGAIDFFCTNGMITGDHNKVMRKNTINFNLDLFAAELKDSEEDFVSQGTKLQKMMTTPITINVRDFLVDLMKSERNADKMNILYNQEVTNRGRNVFALYSAFTNYASYADEQNGFTLRNTGQDTAAERMFKREVEVANWIESDKFKSLIPAQVAA